ncbi:MAG: DMT family transporter [Gammaproteobacteria bacterium]
MPKQPHSFASFLHYPGSAHLGLALASLFWAGNFVVGRALRDVIDPLTLNFWRWLLALVILLVLTHKLLWTYRRELLRHWFLILALGLTGIAAFHTSVYIALTTTTAVNALLLFTLTPLLIMLGAWLFLGERMHAIALLGVIVSLAGALVLIAHGDVQNLRDLSFGHGDLWMLLAVVMWAAYSLLLKRKPPALPQTALVSATTLAALVLMLPFYLWDTRTDLRVLLSAEVLWALVYVALFASVLAFWLWNRGVARIGAAKAGTYLYLMPVFGALLSYVFLGEGVQLFQLIGGALVITGIMLSNRRGAR